MHSPALARISHERLVQLSEISSTEVCWLSHRKNQRKHSKRLESSNSVDLPEFFSRHSFVRGNSSNYIRLSQLRQRHREKMRGKVHPLYPYEASSAADRRSLGLGGAMLLFLATGTGFFTESQLNDLIHVLHRIEGYLFP